MTKIQVGKNTAEVIEQTDFSEWTLEELVRGQRKSKTGRWHGKPPKVIPHALLMELNRRITPEVHKKLLQAADDAAEYVRAVNAGEQEGTAIRLQAATYALNRLLGMPGQKLDAHVTVHESPYEASGVKKAIALRDFSESEVMDAESYELDPWEDPEDDPFGSDETVRPHTPAEADPDPFAESGNPIVDGRPQRKRK
jgi:hypothetical protein